MSDTGSEQLNRSPLDAEHIALGARMVGFAGWSMPIQYTGVMPEHRAVRDAAGVFDISHMGQIWVEGADAAAVSGWLNSVLCNDVNKLGLAEGQYTLMLNEAGGVIDDLLIYRAAEARYLLVVNASRIAVDVAHLEARLAPGIELSNVSDDIGAIAVQGPDSVAVFQKMVAAAGCAALQLPPRNGIVSSGEGDQQFAVCRTGYTGEDGFELFCPTGSTVAWWQRALDAGAEPCGLGARDTLRLEKCYPLNGSDLNEQRTPLEAGLGFFVAFDKGDFVGRPVVAEQKANGVEQRLVALQVIDKGPPPRTHYGVFEKGSDTQLAELTSGTVSPTLGTGIAMAYLPTALAGVGQQVDIDVRGRRFAAEVVKKPFVKSVPCRK